MSTALLLRAFYDTYESHHDEPYEGSSSEDILEAFAFADGDWSDGNLEEAFDEAGIEDSAIWSKEFWSDLSDACEAI